MLNGHILTKDMITVYRHLIGVSFGWVRNFTAGRTS